MRLAFFLGVFVAFVFVAESFVEDELFEDEEEEEYNPRHHLKGVSVFFLAALIKNRVKNSAKVLFA